MAKTYRQCQLSGFDGEIYVCYIPSQYAVLGKHVLIDGFQVEWIVKEVYDGSISSDEAQRMRDDWKPFHEVLEGN